MKKTATLSCITLSALGFSLISCTPKKEGSDRKDVASLERKIDKQNHRIIGVEDELHELRQLLDRNQREVAKLQIAQESLHSNVSRSPARAPQPAQDSRVMSPLIPSAPAPVVYPDAPQPPPSITTNIAPAPAPAVQASPEPKPAPAAPSPAPTQTRKSITYTVKRGDTLSKIAKKYGVTLSAIKRANPRLNPNRINVGAKITIPGSQSSSSTAPSTSPGTRIERMSYRIRTGDTLSGIARKHGVSTKTLQSYNPGVDPSRLSIGKSITVPVRKSDSTQSAPQHYVSNKPAPAARTYNVASRVSQPKAVAPVADHGPKKMIRIARETTLGKIAIDFGTSVHTLNSINSVSLNGSTPITAGSLIYVPVR